MQRPPGGAPADALFQALVENSSDAIALLDADGTIRYASQSSMRVVGHSPEERVGKSAFEMVHPDDRARMLAGLADCLQKPGVPLRLACRFRHKDGTWRHVEAIAVNRLGDPGVAGIVVNYGDVTERKRAEEALRASEERLRRLVESAQDLIYYCDLNGRFTYVNPTAARVVKYDKHELLGRHFLTLVHPDHRKQAAEVYSRQLADRSPNTYLEFPAIAKDGQQIWVGQHVQLVCDGDTITGVQAIARDITRQKEAEAKLRRSERRYRSLIQGAVYGIYRTTLDGRILDANPALAQMLGYDSVDELLPLNMADVYRVREERARIIERYQREGSTTGPVEVEWKRKDGQIIIVRIAARLVDFADGTPCLEGIAEDVTARRALEEQLRQAQKMEAVGRLARGIAHDFNNVLAAIVGCSDLLVERLKEGDPARDDAVEIRKAAEKGASLTRQLLAFSRRQTLEVQPIDLHASVSGLDQMLRRLVGNHIELHIETLGESPRLRAEPGQIEQIVLNLVVNARDAMPEGGCIDLRVDTVDLDEIGVLKYPALPPGRYARVTVSDTGVGMDPEMQRHVFEPFFSTKDPSKGTGLGLSIVYGIAKDLGGTVTFLSTAQEGTTFEVLLPLPPTGESVTQGRSPRAAGR